MGDKSKEVLITNEVILAEYKVVYRYMLSVCGDEHEAEDVTQEAFYKAIDKGDFHGDSSIYSWLCSIAKNLWLNRHKRAKRTTSMEGCEERLSGEGPGFEEQMADKEMSGKIHRILHLMMEPYKEVFTLRVFGELSFKEIAGLFGKTESWARVTYHRARKMIIERVKEDESR